MKKNLLGQNNNIYQNQNNNNNGYDQSIDENKTIKSKTQNQSMIIQKEIINGEQQTIQKKKQKSEIQIVNYQQSVYQSKSVIVPELLSLKTKQKNQCHSLKIVQSQQNRESIQSQSKKRVPQFLKKSLFQQSKRSSIQAFDRNFQRYIQKMFQEDNQSSQQIQKQEMREQIQSSYASNSNYDTKTFSKKNKKKYSQQEKIQIRQKVKKIQQKVPQVRETFLSKIKSIISQKYLCSLCQQEKDQPLMSICKCKHQFCQQCLEGYVSYKISTLNNQITCPQQGCQKEFDEKSLFFQKIPQPIKKKYIRNKLWLQSQKNKDFKLCPRQACDNGLVDLKKIPPKCQKCSKTYCLKCQLQAHKGPCQQNFADFCLQLNWKRCPQCKIIIEKNQGCNHMTCTCKYQFCYECLSKWTNFHYKCRNGVMFQQAEENIVEQYNRERNQIRPPNNQRQNRRNNQIQNQRFQQNNFQTYFAQPIFNESQSECQKISIVLLLPLNMPVLYAFLIVAFVTGIACSIIIGIFFSFYFGAFQRQCLSSGDILFLLRIPFAMTSYAYNFYIKKIIRSDYLCTRITFTIVMLIIFLPILIALII